MDVTMMGAMVDAMALYNTGKKMQRPRSIDGICRRRGDCCDMDMSVITSISRCCIDSRDHYASTDYETGECHGCHEHNHHHNNCCHDHHHHHNNHCHDHHNHCHDHHNHCHDHHHHPHHGPTPGPGPGPGPNPPSTNCLPENFTGEVLSFTDSTITGTNFLAYKIPTLDADTGAFDVQVFRIKDTPDHPVPSGNYAAGIKIAILEILSSTSFKVIQVNNLDDLLSSQTTTIPTSTITYTMLTYILHKYTPTAKNMPLEYGG